jgi:hypothetical protein
MKVVALKRWIPKINMLRPYHDGSYIFVEECLLLPLLPSVFLTLFVGVYYNGLELSSDPRLYANSSFSASVWVIFRFVVVTTVCMKPTSYPTGICRLRAAVGHDVAVGRNQTAARRGLLVCYTVI